MWGRVAEIAEQELMLATAHAPLSPSPGRVLWHQPYSRSTQHPGRILWHVSALISLVGSQVGR